MQKTINWLIAFTLLFVTLNLFPSKEVSARPLAQTSITTPSQLINAVNSLRLSYGLLPLTEHSVLMQSAQSQADYMAATGQTTHTRPGGISYTQQLLTLGFPLAGDLSLGGFPRREYFEQLQSACVEWCSACLAGCRPHEHHALAKFHPHRRGYIAGDRWLLLCAGLRRHNRFRSNADRVRPRF